MSIGSGTRAWSKTTIYRTRRSKRRRMNRRRRRSKRSRLKRRRIGKN